MEDITKQALDMVFNNVELKTKVRKEATPYVASVALFNVLIVVLIVYLIVRVNKLIHLHSSSSSLLRVASSAG
jgi:hypothetical protein